MPIEQNCWGEEGDGYTNVFTAYKHSKPPIALTPPCDPRVSPLGMKKRPWRSDSDQAQRGVCVQKKLILGLANGSAFNRHR